MDQQAEEAMEKCSECGHKFDPEGIYNADGVLACPQCGSEHVEKDD